MVGKPRAPPLASWVGAAFTHTGVLAKGMAKGSAEEIEELGRELGLAVARPPPQGGGPPWSFELNLTA